MHLSCKHKAGVCIEGLKHAGVLLEEVRNQLGHHTTVSCSGKSERYNLWLLRVWSEVQSHRRATAQDPGVAAEEEAAAGIS